MSDGSSRAMVAQGRWEPTNLNIEGAASQEPPRRRAEPHGRSAAAKQPSGHYARGFGRCPFGGELPLMEKAAARSDTPPMGERARDASCVRAENRGAKRRAKREQVCVRNFKFDKIQPLHVPNPTSS